MHKTLFSLTKNEQISLTLSPRGGGGEGYLLNKFLYGKAVPEVQPLTLLYTIFHEKGTPLVYLLLTNGTPFTHLVFIELCIPFNCCKCIVF